MRQKLFHSNLLLSAAIAISPVLGVLALSGCEGESYSIGVAGTDYDNGYYTPGYYYDEGYFDVYHTWHPRRYYYYDGHNHWEERHEVPHGYVARQRRETVRHDVDRRDEHRDIDRDHR